jgi:hypothetical protein
VLKESMFVSQPAENRVCDYGVTQNRHSRHCGFRAPVELSVLTCRDRKCLVAWLRA